MIDPPRTIAYAKGAAGQWQTETPEAQQSLRGAAGRINWARYGGSTTSLQNIQGNRYRAEICLVAQFSLK